MDRKERFSVLSSLCRIPIDELADKLGITIDTLRTYRKPSHPRQPSASVVNKMEALYLESLRSEVLAAGYEIFRRAA